MVSKIALIVGVGPGLGAAAAVRFAKEGFAIALVSRSLDHTSPVEAAIKASGGQALSVACDTGKPEAVRSAMATIQKELGGSPEVLVYNAGPKGLTWPPSSMLDTSAEDFATSFNSGVVGGYAWAQLVLPSMIAAGHGTILFSGATASKRGSARFALLACPKFALRGLSECLSREFQPQGIHVAHVIIDGMIGTAAQLAQPDLVDKRIDPAAIADTYWHLHSQHKSSWTLELEVRPFTEKF